MINFKIAETPFLKTHFVVNFNNINISSNTPYINRHLMKFIEHHRVHNFV